MLRKAMKDPLYAEKKREESEREERFERFIREQERLLQCWEAQAADYIAGLLRVFPHLALQRYSREIVFDDRRQKAYYRIGPYQLSPEDETLHDLCMDVYGDLFIREPAAGRSRSSGRRPQSAAFHMTRITASREKVSRGIAHTLFRDLDLYRDGPEQTRARAEQRLCELESLWLHDLLLE